MSAIMTGPGVFEVFARLLDDPHRLVHFVEAHHEARVGVAFGARNHVELVVFVTAVRERAPHVVRHAGRAQRGSGDAPRDRVVGVEDTDVDHAVLQDRVLLQERAQIAHARIVHRDQLVDFAQKALGQIVAQAADAQVVRMHARAAGEFGQVEDAFAQIEGVEKARNRAEIDAARAEPNAVRRDAVQFAQQNARMLSARSGMSPEMPSSFSTPIT